MPQSHLDLHYSIVLLVWHKSICSLPWQGLKAATKKQKYDKICEKKLSTPIEVSRNFVSVIFFNWFVSVITVIMLFNYCYLYKKFLLSILLLKGFMQVSSSGVCFILPLLPFLDIWSTSRLWIFEASFSRTVHSWRYLLSSKSISSQRRNLKSLKNFSV